MHSYATMDVEYLESFDVFAMINDKWELLINHALREPIPLYEMDGDGHIEDTTQQRINEAMDEIINDIKQNETFFPPLYTHSIEYENEINPPIMEILYIPKRNRHIIKLVGVTTSIEERFPI